MEDWELDDNELNLTCQKCYYDFGTMMLSDEIGFVFHCKFIRANADKLFIIYHDIAPLVDFICEHGVTGSYLHDIGECIKQIKPGAFGKPREVLLRLYNEFTSDSEMNKERARQAYLNGVLTFETPKRTGVHDPDHMHKTQERINEFLKEDTTMLDKCYDYEPAHVDDDPDVLHEKYKEYFDNNTDVLIEDVIEKLIKRSKTGQKHIDGDLTLKSLLIEEESSNTEHNVYDFTECPRGLLSGIKNGAMFKQQNPGNEIHIIIRDNQCMTASFMIGLLKDEFIKYGDDLVVQFTSASNELLKAEWNRAITRMKMAEQ